MKNVAVVLRSLAFLLLAIASIPSYAGYRFDYVAEAAGYTYSGKMTLDGNRIRVDVVAGNHPLFNPGITMITRDAGAQIVVLDHGRKTYFQRAGSQIAGPLATVRGIGPTTATKARVSKHREPLEGDLERYVVNAEYGLEMEIEGEKIIGSVEIEAQFDIDPHIRQRAHPWGLQYAAKTGFDRVDEAVYKKVPDYLAVHQVVTATRQIGGGPAMTERLIITLSNIVEEPVSDDVFKATPGYRYEEPVFSFGQ